MTLSSQNIQKSFFLRGNKKILFVMAVLIIVGGIEMGLWGKRQWWHNTQQDRAQEVRLIPFGSVGQNETIRFLPGEKMIKVEMRPTKENASPWIEAIPGQRITVETPHFADGKTDSKAWICREREDHTVMCSNDADPPKFNPHPTAVVRIWGGGGDGYAFVSCH